MTEAEKWMLFLTLAGVLVGIGGLVVAIVVASKKTPVEITSQPVQVQVTEELHQLFAAKRDFEHHVKETKEEFARVNRERSEDLRLAAVSRRTMYDKQDSLRTEMNRGFQGVERAIGRLEGKSED